MELISELRWFSIPDENFTLYGVRDDLRRIAPDVAKSISAGIGRQAPRSAGGRLRFRTNSKTIHIKAYFSENRGVGFDLYRLRDGEEYFVTGFKMKNMPSCLGWFEASRTVGDGETMQEYTLNLPYGGRVDELFVAIDKDAVVEPGAAYINEKPVIYYGSSIVHGFASGRPGMTYTAQISQKYNLNYINFGFAGNAKGEPAMAEYIAKMPMCAFVCDYDHNAPDAEHLQATHLPFYKIIRAAYPDIPYIMCTSPNYHTNPEEFQKREDVIRATYEYAKANGDDKVWFLQGKKFFNGENYHSCTLDGLHPNDVGNSRMAKHIGAAVAEALGLPEKLHDFMEY